MKAASTKGARSAVLLGRQFAKSHNVGRSMERIAVLGSGPDRAIFSRPSSGLRMMSGGSKMKAPQMTYIS